MNSLLELTKPIALEREPDEESSSNKNDNSFPSDPYMNYFPIALDNYIEIKSKIQEFCNLLENWDSYDASIITTEVVSNAMLFISNLPAPILSKLSASDVTPTNYGTIVFDWYDSDENFVSIEVGRTKIGGFYEFNGKSEKLTDELIDALENFKFLNIINRLYRSQFEVNA